MKRLRLSSAERILIACQQEYKCNHCKKLLPATWEADHILALMNGGSNSFDNFQILCPNCHAAKTQAEMIQRAKDRAEEFGWTWDERRLLDPVSDRVQQVQWIQKNASPSHSDSLSTDPISYLDKFRYKPTQKAPATT